MVGLIINGAPNLAEYVRSFEGSSICSFVFLVAFKYIHSTLLAVYRQALQPYPI